MENTGDIIIYQTEDGNTKIDVRLENETVWMTQKGIAELYQTTPQNITLHIKNIFKVMNGQKHSNFLPVIKEEGSRKVKRNILHYNLDIIFNIALRGQYFEEFNRLTLFVKTKGISQDYLQVVPIKEREFGELLQKSLTGIEEVIPQYRIHNYIVDFYLPGANLIIEYDEKHHKHQLIADMKRQKSIEKEMNFTFVRVAEDFELEGLNNILKRLFEMRKE